MSLNPTILQILPELVSGGVERGTIEIAQSLGEAGWGNLVVSAGGPMLQALGRTGATHLCLPVQRKHPWHIYQNVARLEAIIRERGVSLIHARSRVPAWVAYLAARRCDIPFVTTFHGVYGTHGPFKKRYNAIMTRGAKVIAVSRYIRDHILAEYPSCPAQRIEVIHRGADLSVFSPERVTPGILGELSEQWRLLDQHAPVILMPGRITRWKGHGVFIEALSRLRQRDFLALIVGDSGGHPAYAAELEQRINAAGLAGKVRFTGPTRHMSEAYALADIVVAPSVEPEAFGRVPVEAQAMEKPVIAADHGGAKETILDQRTGFLVPPGDAEALARQLERVLELTPAGRAAIGQAGRAHVAGHFSIARMQEKTLALYGSLL